MTPLILSAVEHSLEEALACARAAGRAHGVGDFTVARRLTFMAADEAGRATRLMHGCAHPFEIEVGPEVLDLEAVPEAIGEDEVSAIINTMHK